MADNVTLNAGAAGAVLATDDITGVHYQIVKTGFGALDSVTLAASGAGAVSAGVQRITLASDDPGVVLLTTIDADTGNIVTAVQIMDDWDNGASDGASVSGDVAHDGADAGEPVKIGGRAQATAPTAVSLDGDRVNAWFLLNGAQATVLTAAGALIGGDAANGLDVDVTRVGGTVAVTQSGTWDEVGINDSGNSITVDWAGTAPPIGAGVEATALRVTVATDSTGVLSVDDNGSALTVDNGGTFAVQVDGAALTALQLIDNTILVDDAAFTPATSSVSMAGFQADETATDSVDEGDAGAARMTLTRKVIVTPQPHISGGLSIFRSIDIDETEEEVKATAGQLYVIHAMNLTTGILYLKFYNDTAANVIVGTTAPVLTFPVPANADTDGAGFVLSNDLGWAFSAAITVACTGALADNDATAPAANACVINLGYL